MCNSSELWIGDPVSGGALCDIWILGRSDFLSTSDWVNDKDERKDVQLLVVFRDGSATQGDWTSAEPSGKERSTQPKDYGAGGVLRSRAGRTDEKEYDML